MKLCLSVAALVALFCAVDGSLRRAPKVQLYSRNPGEYGKDNTLICHVSQFHPPDISITLLCNGEELKGSTLTDLAFKQDWHFHLTRSAPFSPAADTRCTCKIDHGGRVTAYDWDPNM